MKITIWIVTAEYDMERRVDAFASEDAAMEHIRREIVRLTDEGGLNLADVPHFGGDNEDLWEAWNYVREDSLDSLYLDPVDIEIGNLAVVTEGGVPQLIASGPLTGREYVAIDYDTDGADPAELFAIPQHGKPATEGFWRVFEIAAAHREIPISPDAEPTPVAPQNS